jgi:hypothetical protein
MHRPLFPKDGLQTLQHFIVLNSTKDNVLLAGTGLLRPNHLHERQKALPVCPTHSALFCQHTWAAANGKLSYQASDAAGTGRLVIAGRMADVCAELDRLAASEAVRA